ncbi:MAG: hypothetical protein CML66_28270 [Rhodobacteraceae bacterium]|nr:hypothetical protein [Paracoccaceae bacterium]MAY47787.1 hypothetical protein [Paracoccaceae bacterium]
MGKTWACAIGLASLALTSSAAAADYSAASAEALTEAAIAAVGNEDRRDLLAILQEMQRRQMYFFRADDTALCKRDAPKVGILATNILDWGKARQAYFTYNQMQRLEEQSCACPQKARSFDTFSEDLLGVAPEEIGEAEMSVLRTFVEEHKHDVFVAYDEFFNSNCRQTP